MLSQSQNNAVVNLQKQTTYGLSTRSTQNSVKEGPKIASRVKGSKKAKENPLTQQDMNASTSKSRSKDRSALKGRTARACPPLGRNNDNSLSPMKTQSPKIGAKKRINAIKSPAPTSIASSGKKTPCISALVQQQSSVVSADFRGPSAQKSSSRYEKNAGFIEEEEHDSSSFLAAEREAQRAAATEGSASIADSRSQLSQNLIGAHLVKSKDLYPYCPREVFQTPQPMRDDAQSYPSPMTSFRNLQQSNMHVGRVDLLQMSQKTNVTNKVLSKAARISYEKDSQASMTISPIKELTAEALSTSMNTRIEQAELHTVPQPHQKSSAIQQPSPLRKNVLYERSNELSGLALNVRQQTSPEQPSSKKEGYSPTNIEIDCEGHVTVIANALGQVIENSYDQDQGTRLIEDNTMSPESTNKLLNPYFASAEHRNSRLSSINRQLKTTSPANIKMEPVRVGGQTPSGFEHQRKASIDVMKACGSLRNSPIKEASRSPSKASTLKSPSPMGKSPQPARQIHAYSIKETDQSPDNVIGACAEHAIAGTTIRSQSMYENLMCLQIEQEVVQPTLHATITEEDENCATISASELSIRVAEQHSAQQQTHQGSAARPKSSQNQSRRRREERKTPTGRKTVSIMEKYARNSKEECFSAVRRSKYNSSSNNTGAQSLDISGGSGGNQVDDKLSSSSATARRTGLKKSLSTNQGAQISVQEHRKLANLAKARQYGNRASEQNKSTNNLRESSPNKKVEDVTPQSCSNSTQKGKTRVSRSPIKPEIMSVTDLSLVISNPKASAQTLIAEKRGKRKSSSVAKRNKHEVKMSRAAQMAKADFMRKQAAAKKIQRAYRDFKVFVLKQQEQQAKIQMAFINLMATRIQRAFKMFMSRNGLKRAVEKRRRLKMVVADLCKAWRTRRSLNCLGAEVQEFVNCENHRQRFELRNYFHMLFSKVVRNRLYLESNFDKLQKLKTQIAQKMQQAKTRNRNSKPNSANRTRASQPHEKQMKGETDSPFKKQQQSPSNYNQASMISLQNMNESSLASLHRQSLKQQANRIQSQSNVSNSRSRDQIHGHQQRMQGLNSSRKAPNQIASQRLLNSAGSTGSAANIAACEETLNINLVRSSFDNQAMNQLRDFIQNSDRKRDKYCSIQFTNGFNERSMTLQLGQNGTQNQESSHVLVQVHNGNLQDVVSPTQQSKPATEANPVAAVNPPNDRLSQKRLTEAPEPVEASLQAKPSVTKLNGERKPSAETSTEYRQNLKKVRPRVDCWNRSTTRGETTRGELTPNNDEQKVTNQTIDQRHSQTTDLQSMRQEQRANSKSESVMKTPMHPKRTTTNIIQNSFSSAVACKNPQVLNTTNSKKQLVGESEQRSRSINMLSLQQRTKSKSMLREPTKFNTNAKVQERRQSATAPIQTAPAEVRRMNANSQNGRQTAPLNSAPRQSQQQMRPKSSRQQIQQTAAQQSATNLKQFINASKPQERRVAQAQSKAQAPATIQTQIFQMRETVANLTQAMEQIAAEADARHREQVQNKGGFGLNSQHRAAVKSLSAQDKLFNGLVATLCEQFASFRDEAMPSNSNASQSEDI